jgi:hypothetical protein
VNHSTFSRRSSKDVDHDEIMETLRAFGWVMVDTHDVGRLVPGFPDAIGGLNEVTDLFEFKRDAKVKLRDSQIEFARTWRGSKIIRLDSKAHTIEWATRTRHERSRRANTPLLLAASPRVDGRYSGPAKNGT